MSCLVHFFKEQSKSFRTALFVVAFLSGVAFGQTDSGQINGRVIDPNGANISGGIVQAKSVFTGIERMATTTEEGFFILTNLPPGVYEVTVQAQGFAVRGQRVRVFVGSVVRVDVQLSVTPVQVEEEVLEGSGGVDVNTQSGQLSDPISRRQLAELPIITRDPYALITLSGNVAPFRINPLGGFSLVGLGPVVFNTEPDQDFAIDGQPPTTNNVQVDGGENIVNYWSTLGQRITGEGVQEINVITNGFRPEYGRLLGGLINVATRSGSDNWRGSIFEFYRGDALNSNSFEANALGIGDNHLVGNNFGYAFGGPLVDDRLFFFNSTEVIKVRSRENRVALVPAAAFLDPTLISPNTTNFFAAFPSLTPTRINPDPLTASEVLALIGPTLPGGPFATFAAANPGLPVFNQIFFDVPTDLGGGLPQDTVLTVARMDYTRSDRSLIYGRYAFVDRDIYRGALSFSPFAGFNTGVGERDHMAVINWLQTLSGPGCCSGPGASAWLMNLKASYNRVNLTRDLDRFVNPAFGSSDLTPRLAPTGFVGANIGGFPLAFPGDFPFDPTVNSLITGPLNLFQVSADFAGVWGGHNVQFGGSYYYFQDNRNIFSFQNGLFTLGSNVPTALDGLVSGLAGSFSTAINPTVGIDPTTTPPTFTATPVQPNFNRSVSANDFSLYGSFNWRITPNVNLLLGLRYDIFGRPHSRNDQVFFNFFPGTGTDAGTRISNGVLAPTGLVDIDGDGDIDDSFFHKDTNNIAPRIGFAWDITGGAGGGCCPGINRSTTLRASFGLTYERLFYATAPFFQTRFDFAIPSVTVPSDIGAIPLIQPGATVPSNFGPLVPGTALPGLLTRGIERDLDAPRLTFWTVALDREISRNTVVSLQYAGAHGHDLFTLTNINRPGSSLFFLGVGGATDRVNTAISPAVSTTLDPIFFLRNEGRSNFNAFIADLSNSTWRTNGLTLTARYRFSKALDNVSSFFGNNFGVFGGSFTPDLLSPLDPDFDYGLSDFDVRHRFISSVIWELPYKDSCCGGSDFRKRLVSGWAVTGIFNFQTGFPFNVFDCGGALTPETPCPRALIAPGVDLGDIRSGQGSTVPDPVITNRFNFIDVANFTRITPPGATVFPPFPTNTIGRNSFRGPGFWNIDLGLYKRFHISEETSFQLRGEFYNVFNHANLAVPLGVDIGSDNFVPAFKRGRRVIQLGAKFIF